MKQIFINTVLYYTINTILYYTINTVLYYTINMHRLSRDEKKFQKDIEKAMNTSKCNVFDTSLVISNPQADIKDDEG